MNTAAKVITNPKYISLVLIVTLGLIAFAAWLPNLHLITQTMTSSTMTLWEKTNLIGSLLGSLQTNFTAFSRSLTILSAFLAGIQTALLTFYIRQTALLQQTMGVSFLGTAASLLGAGCASCGSVVLTTVFGFSSMAIVLEFLPLKGQEFGILGVGILLLVIKQTVGKINHPNVCKIEKRYYGKTI